MGTAAKLSRAQQDVLKASTLAEAQSILKELVAEEQEVSDIFFTQQQMIDSLNQLLLQKDAEQPVYVQPAAPAPSSPNYLLYVAIGIGALFLLRKVKI